MKVPSLSNTVKLAIALASCSWSATAQDDFRDCSAYPDPHFIGWGGMLPPTPAPTTSNRRERHLRVSDVADVEESPSSPLTSYDYDGGCRIVLIKKATVEIHMSTVAVVGSTYIQEVGLKVGSDVADLKASADGIVLASTIPSFLGGYSLTCSSQLCELTLSNGQYVRVNAFGNSLSVLVHGLASDFGNAKGMCGSWENPGLIDRDGKATLSTGNEMGLEWKVNSGDSPFIGYDDSCTAAIPHRGECKDTGCLCRPELATGECACADDLGGCLCKAECITEEQVEEACKNIADAVQRANCKHDVKVTGDVDFGKAPWYQTPEPPLSHGWCDAGVGNKCAEKGGECVFDCVESEEFICNKELCGESDESPDHPPTHLRKLELDRCACRYPKIPNEGNIFI